MKEAVSSKEGEICENSRKVPASKEQNDIGKEGDYQDFLNI